MKEKGILNLGLHVVLNCFSHWWIAFFFSRIFLAKEGVLLSFCISVANIDI